MKSAFILLIFEISTYSVHCQSNETKPSLYLLPEFTQGVVLMKSGKRNEVKLNYHTYGEEMMFDNRGNKFAIGKGELDKVDTVFIGERRFIVLDNKFVELLSQSTYELYAAYKCKLENPGKSAGMGGTSGTTPISSYSAYHSETGIYNLELPDGYVVKPFTHYWIRKGGELKQFTTLKQLMKLFKTNKDQFKAYVKDHDIKYDDPEEMAQLVEYLGTL